MLDNTSSFEALLTLPKLYNSNDDIFLRLVCGMLTTSPK